MDAAPVTVTSAVPAEGKNVDPPVYCAVTVLRPAGSFAASTVRRALAEPPESARIASPSDFWPARNETAPEGMAAPAVGLTVAVRVVEAPASMLAGLAVMLRKVEVMPEDDVAAQLRTNLSTSSEPKPVAAS